MQVDEPVDAHGLTPPPGVSEVLDVLFDGERVWSFNPERDAVKNEETSTVRWPKALTRYLDGKVRMTLRGHVSWRTYSERDVSFGSSEKQISVRDELGNPLAVDKGGRLQRTFSRTDDSSRMLVVEATERVLHDLTHECDLDAYLAYGCLLGAVRDGHMIGHDSDSDVAYLSKHTHPFDIIRECQGAARKMRDLGWTVMRMSGANFKIWVPLPDGRRCGIDVFGSFHIGDHFHITGSKRGFLDRSVVLPLSSVVLEGHEIAAPAKPEEFLAFTYGPGWRTPDPAFHFDHDPLDVRRMDAWWRGSRRHLRFWSDFYKSPQSARVPSEPSLFARWVDEQVRESAEEGGTDGDGTEGDSAEIVDVGAGNGRDAVWFAEQGYRVTALDFAVPARAAVQKLARVHRVEVRVQALNLQDLRSTLVAGARLAHEGGSRHLYARGLLDSLTPGGRKGLWRFASMAQRRGGLTFLEFRIARSPAAGGFFFGRHPRTFLRPNRVVAEIEEYGGHVVHRVEGPDLAPLESENPKIARLVVRWRT